MPPHFVETAKREAGLLIKAFRRPYGYMCDCVPRSIGFAKNVCVAVTFGWPSIHTNSGKNAGRAIAIVGPLAECVMDPVGDRNCLGEPRRDGTGQSVARDDRFVLTCRTGSAMNWSKGICWACIIYKNRTGRKIPTGGLKFTSVGVKRVEQVSRHDGFFRSIIYFSFFAGFLFGARGRRFLSLEKFLSPLEIVTWTHRSEQANEFGLNKTMTIAPLIAFLQDIHSLGLETAQGLITSEPFYWNMNDRTRAFTRRVLPKTPNNYPSQAHAGCYAITLHYLKTAAAMGSAAAKASGRTTVARMKSIPTEDDAFGQGSIRADGRGVFPSYLLQVKTPAESTGEWDLYKVLATTPATEVLHPLLDKCRFPTSA